MSKEFFCIIYH